MLVILCSARFVNMTRLGVATRLRGRIDFIRLPVEPIWQVRQSQGIVIFTLLPLPDSLYPFRYQRSFPFSLFAEDFLASSCERKAFLAQVFEERGALRTLSRGLNSQRFYVILIGQTFMAVMEPPFLDDPVIVIDEDPDTELDHEEPILLRFRQPSFTNLYGIPVPKGFTSLSEFRATRPPVACLPHLDSSIRASSSTQELLDNQNVPKWQSMGYTPSRWRKVPHSETCPPRHPRPPAPSSDRLPRPRPDARADDGRTALHSGDLSDQPASPDA
jgi:hypothetical protein